MGLGWFVRCGWIGWYGCVSEVVVKGGFYGFDSIFFLDIFFISFVNLFIEVYGVSVIRYGLVD